MPERAGRTLAVDVRGVALQQAGEQAGNGDHAPEDEERQRVHGVRRQCQHITAHPAQAGRIDQGEHQHLQHAGHQERRPQDGQQLGLSLAIIGDGPERPYLEKVALDSRAKVTFLGELSQDELPSWIRSADCFVLNSSFEATSYSLLEARASGLFCIANGSTGSDEVINHKIDGLLCDKLSFTLIEALSRFKNDKTFVRKARSLSILDAHNRFNQSTNFRIIKELLL